MSCPAESSGVAGGLLYVLEVCMAVQIESLKLETRETVQSDMLQLVSSDRSFRMICNILHDGSGITPWLLVQLMIDMMLLKFYRRV